MSHIGVSFRNISKGGGGGVNIQISKCQGEQTTVKSLHVQHVPYNIRLLTY